MILLLTPFSIAFSYYLLQKVLICNTCPIFGKFNICIDKSGLGIKYSFNRGNLITTNSTLALPKISSTQFVL